MNDNTKQYQQWKNILDVDALKENINITSLFIMVYELLEDGIVTKPKDFYTIIEFDEKAQQEYRKNVLSLYDKSACPEVPGKRKELVASLIWFKNAGAINDEDIQIFANYKRLRNKLVHEMLMSIAEGAEKILEQFALMYALFCRIEKWWILEYEIPINPDITDFKAEDNDEVLSGNMIILDVIMDILSNNSNENFSEICEMIGVQVKK